MITLILLSSIAHAHSPLQGVVVRLTDGDSITVYQNSKQYNVRLYGIATPEKRQDFWQKAKQFTSDIVFNRTARVIPVDIDRYDRIVGMVYVNGECLNEELVKAGYAWVYQKYCKESFCNDWLKLEQKARRNKRGLWAYDNPVAPWDYRHDKSIQKADYF